MKRSISLNQTGIKLCRLLVVYLLNFDHICTNFVTHMDLNVYYPGLSIIIARYKSCF
jgi:hypothetical protein